MSFPSSANTIDSSASTSNCCPPSAAHQQSSAAATSSDDQCYYHYNNTNHLFACRAALALNNLATRMLAESCHGQAFRTFEDAVSVMKTFVAPYCTSGKPTPSAQDYQQVYHKLEQARRRRNAPVVSSNPTTAAHPRICVISSGDSTAMMDPNVAAGMDASAKRANGISCYTVIRIEAGDNGMLVNILDDISNQNQEFQLLLAMILYNFGIAALCKASSLFPQKQPSSAAAHHKLSNYAKYLFKLSGKLLEGIWSYGLEDPFLMPQIIFVSSCLLQAQTQVLNQAGRTTEAMSMALKLADLRRLAREHGATAQEVFYGTYSRAAPAA